MIVPSIYATILPSINPKFHIFIQTPIHPFNLNSPISLLIHKFHPLDNLTNRLFIHPSICLYVQTSTHPTMEALIYPYINPFIHSAINPAIYLSVRLSIQSSMKILSLFPAQFLKYFVFILFSFKYCPVYRKPKFTFTNKLLPEICKSPSPLAIIKLFGAIITITIHQPNGVLWFFAFWILLPFSPDGSFITLLRVWLGETTFLDESRKQNQLVWYYIFDHESRGNITSEDDQSASNDVDRWGDEKKKNVFFALIINSC